MTEENQDQFRVDLSSLSKEQRYMAAASLGACPFCYEPLCGCWQGFVIKDPRTGKMRLSTRAEGREVHIVDQIDWREQVIQTVSSEKFIFDDVSDDKYVEVFLFILATANQAPSMGTKMLERVPESYQDRLNDVISSKLRRAAINDGRERARLQVQRQLENKENKEDKEETK